MEQSVIFKKHLIDRYNKPGPRYTSYPSAVQFHGFDEDQYRKVVAETNADPIPNPLSLYIHIPFCNTVCYYCGCNKIITANRKHAVPYLKNLHKEIELQGKLFDSDRPVDQLHFGGGTPTYISDEQFCELMTIISEHFRLHEDDTGEYSIEVDPRSVNTHTIFLLRKLGLNRISFGVQDFDPSVQNAVNRLQTFEQSHDVINAAKKARYLSINIDLIYGLPLQSTTTFDQTLQKVIELNPDRIAIYNYAHLPHIFKTQKQINADDLPSPEEKLQILQLAIHSLTEAGYVYIGMDHFAKPEDELAIAQKNNELYRNFQGYSTHSNCDVIGLGMTAIGKIANVYSQNKKTLEEYDKDIRSERIPIFRGYTLDFDDQLRAEVISKLICNFYINLPMIEDLYRIGFNTYFTHELSSLKRMQDDGLLEIGENYIKVLPAGRLLIRNICTVFDKYLKGNDTPDNFSKLI